MDGWAEGCEVGERDGEKLGGGAAWTSYIDHKQQASSRNLAIPEQPLEEAAVRIPTTTGIICLSLRGRRVERAQRSEQD